MPWELMAVHPNGHRLGRTDEVKVRVSQAWPSVQWREQRPLLERIRNMPDHPFHKLIPTWSAESQRRAALPRTVGIFEGESISIEIFGIDEDPVVDLNLGVRGSGDPVPSLMRLASLLRWSIKELATDRVLDEVRAKESWAAYHRTFGRGGVSR